MAKDRPTIKTSAIDITGSPASDDSKALTVRLSSRKLTRRQMLSQSTLGLAGSVLLLKSQIAEAAPPEKSTVASQGEGPDNSAAAVHDHHASHHTQTSQTGDYTEPGVPGRDYTPVIAPNAWTLPYTVVEGVKVFHLVAEELDHEFTPGLEAHCWGYNGSVHGPVIEAVEGDRVRIFVTNRLSAPTTVHWHGILLPSGMDGVGGLSQRAIRKGETFMYEFPLIQHGTFMYHSHHDEMTQMGMGMVGLFIVHPRNAETPRPDRDFAFMLHEWAIEVGTSRPNTLVMNDFNLLTFNARAFPGTAPIVAKLGDRVRMRFGNLSAMDHHPIHLHGYNFTVTETDGGRIPAAGRWPETTVLVPVGSTRTVEFTADNPGDWAMHCHMTHHVMNQMGHDFPNMIGVDSNALDKKVQALLPEYMTMGQHGMGDMGEMGMSVPSNSVPMVGGHGPHDYITMGGMFTILKVREAITSYSDPGWYENPRGTQALPASREQLQQNSIKVDGSSAPKPPANLHEQTSGTETRQKPEGNNGASKDSDAHSGHDHRGHSHHGHRHGK